jgi:uncharacterized protein YggT (Ycf19 family)
MLLDAISEVELFVDVFVGVYTLALIAFIITSWLPMPYALRGLQRFLHEACAPYLRLWRRLLPFSAGGIDFSPIVAIFALGALDRIITAVLEQFH